MRNQMSSTGLAVPIRWLLLFAVAAAVVVSGCDLVGDDTDEQAQQEQSEATAEDQQQAEEAPTAPASTTAAPTPQPSGPPPPPQARGGGEGVTAYNIVFPSLALVMAGELTATGLVISDGFVAVDGQPLEGAETVDVALSNGDTLVSLPLAGRDALTGLAYYGPVESALIRLLPGARLGDGENLRPGSAVYAVGYLQSDTSSSIPSVYSGVLSGFEEWETGGRTMLRTDARPDGQSAGMVLLDGNGTVIGMAPLAMVARGRYVSTGDLARGRPPNAVTPGRSLGPETAANEHTFSLGPQQATAEVLLGDQATGQSVLLVVATTEPATLQMLDSNDDALHEVAIGAGSTILTLEPNTAGPYRLLVIRESLEAETAEIQFRADVPLLGTSESEEQLLLSPEEPLLGNIDIAGDVDTFTLDLQAGATYEVRAESLLVDTVLRAVGGGIDATDDDSGGGPSGSDSVLVLMPESDGIAQLKVSDYAGSSTGTYVLSVVQTGGGETMDDEPSEDAAMAMSTVMLPTPAAPPASSIRGIGTAEGLQATLIGVGSQAVANGLLIADADGSFEIIVSVVGVNGAGGRLTVVDSGGQLAVEGGLLVTCSTDADCLARTIFVANESGSGEWLVELTADEPGIREWQIEVFRRD